jgi:predicted  nucleic acid-binding Zn-ribbon protein
LSETSVSQASLLYRLQTLDLGIAQRRARLQEIEIVLGQDEAVRGARQRFEAADSALKPWQTRVRDLDLEIKSLAQKIQQTDRSLYSGKITNPKELQDMQEDIASLKRRQSQLEDELLEAMMKSEEGQTAVAEAQRQLNEAQAAWAGSQVDLLDEKQRLEKEVADWQAQRQQAAAAVDLASLSKYEALRPKKRGQAVALLKGDSCVLCGVEQTSRIVQQVRQGTQLIYCESCGRILATP